MCQIFIREQPRRICVIFYREAARRIQLHMCQFISGSGATHMCQNFRRGATAAHMCQFISGSDAPHIAPYVSKFHRGTTRRMQLHMRQFFIRGAARRYATHMCQILSRSDAAGIAPYVSIFIGERRGVCSSICVIFSRGATRRV